MRNWNTIVVCKILSLCFEKYSVSIRTDHRREEMYFFLFWRVITPKEWLKVTLNCSPLQKNEDETHLFRDPGLFTLVALSHHLQTTEVDITNLSLFEIWLFVLQAVSSWFLSHAFLKINFRCTICFFLASFFWKHRGTAHLNPMALTEIHLPTHVSKISIFIYMNILKLNRLPAYFFTKILSREFLRMRSWGLVWLHKA